MVRAQIASASLVSRVVRRQFQDRNEHQASVPMATQDSRGILFTHTQPQQGFRLLEIPPELEALLTSKDPPVLELKSPSAALALAVKDPAAQEYVNLCTATQTYRIRQVQSSNSLHILRPSHGEISQADIKVVEEEAGESGALNLPDEAVTAIAKCGSTLELHMPPGGLSAIPFLEKSLRLYDPRGDDDGDVSMDEGVVTRVLLTRSMRGNEFVPIFLCLRRRIDLEKQFLVGDLWKSVLDDDDSDPPFPRALLEAVVRKLCKADERPPLDDAMKWASFDKAECSRWVGETHLAATAPTVSSAIGRSEFLRAWKDCLPESWRDEAALSKLQNGIYQSPDPTTICFVEPSQRQASSETSTAKPAANANAKNTRNWHELLKNQKRQ
ncbi:Sister chromatid cohesion protein Dcc1 [Penicillium chermesinum]|nr:Sister chromatid cohesion protein Dcc1 [Penicillium chermesinum]